MPGDCWSRKGNSYSVSYVKKVVKRIISGSHFSNEKGFCSVWSIKRNLNSVYQLLNRNSYKHGSMKWYKKSETLSKTRTCGLRKRNENYSLICSLQIYSIKYIKCEEYYIVGNLPSQHYLLNKLVGRRNERKQSDHSLVDLRSVCHIEIRLNDEGSRLHDRLSLSGLSSTITVVLKAFEGITVKLAGKEPIKREVAVRLQ